MLSQPSLSEGSGNFAILNPPQPALETSKGGRHPCTRLVNAIRKANSALRRNHNTPVLSIFLT